MVGDNYFLDFFPFKYIELIGAVLFTSDNKHTYKVCNVLWLGLTNNLLLTIEFDFDKLVNGKLPRSPSDSFYLNRKGLSFGINRDYIKVRNISGKRCHYKPASSKLTGYQVFSDLLC